MTPLTKQEITTGKPDLVKSKAGRKKGDTVAVLLRLPALDLARMRHDAQKNNKSLSRHLLALWKFL